MTTKTLVWLGVVAAVLAGILAWRLPEEPRACTEEAKICPDGSAVGRSGPRCEFDRCPGETR